jgi:hypothetical protein
MTPAAAMGSSFKVDVHTTHHRGSTPEEIAERCLDKIISISASAPEPIRLQAEAFRERLRHILVLYLHEAAQSERATLSERLKEKGLSEVALMLRSL